MQRPGTLTIARRAVAATAALLAVTGLVATATAGPATGRTTSAKVACTRTVVAAGDMEGVTAPRATGHLAVSLAPNLVAALGDEQYPRGSLTTFKRYYANTGWGRLKPITRPVPGNHEYQTPGAAGYYAYFNYPPRYYAYNLGCGWRAYALNSEIPFAHEAAWLQRDLAAHPYKMALAYWHRPFLSSSRRGGEIAMVSLWRPFVGRPTLVLNGHVHAYERFAPRHQIREIVVGTGGSSDQGFRHPAARGSLKRITHTPGVLLLHLRVGSYTWSFRNTSNRTLDSGIG
jgi:acid phosphatase type 7